MKPRRNAANITYGVKKMTKKTKVEVAMMSQRLTKTVRMIKQTSSPFKYSTTL
jgi:hypothetical protein